MRFIIKQEKQNQKQLMISKHFYVQRYLIAHLIAETYKKNFKRRWLINKGSLLKEFLLKAKPYNYALI